MGVNVNPGKAGRSHEVACDEFLARYSDYIDGLLSPVEAAQMSTHATVCRSCARYDRIVRKGLELVRDLPAAVPSEEFELRLQHRIFHMEDAHALQPRASGTATALGVAAAIALLAWSPLFVVPGEQEMAAAPALVENADGAGSVSLFSESGWYPMALPAGGQHPSGLLAVFPGPYSPLVVTPPAHRSVRPVSTEYVSID